jgi:hypothetical protein
VTGSWRKLHIAELHNLYISPSVIRMKKSRRMRWAGHVARMTAKNAYRILAGKPERKRPLGKPTRTWVEKRGMKGLAWTGLIWLTIAASEGLL